MSQELFQRLERLFFELEDADNADRAKQLAALRAEDPTLADHLEQLLRAHTTEILPSDAPSGSHASEVESFEPATVPVDLEQGSPSRFRLIRLIGEGGMGTVHEAEQLAPVKRQVAIKLIRGAAASRNAVARFEVERQTLATLNHPNIARVFEAGADQEGRLFFAMELVDGVPITDYCDRHRLSARKRIELFQQVCEGISHAHRNGIIHRDLKPSNILIEEHQGRANAKIIDFGIAKVISPWTADPDEIKLSALPVGTPEYMSPEQFLNGEIDTRSDIYALGVLLFELLVGQLPISGKSLRRRSVEEMRRQVRDLETPSPSSRVATATEGAEALAQLRDTAPAALARLLRGEIDWIVLKALAKEPVERYESVPALASDLHSFLNHEPVSVGPPTWTYRTKKWVRRNRVSAGLAGLVSAAILVGLVGLAVGLQQARRAEAKASYEALVRGEVIDFLSTLLSRGAQSLEQGKEVSVRDLFVRAQQELRDDPPSDAVVRGTLLNRIGDFHHMDLQAFDTAAELYREAETVLRAADPDGTELSTSLYMLGINARIRGELEKAKPLLNEALMLRQKSLGEDSVSVAAVLGELAMVARLEGDLPRALANLTMAVNIAERATGTDSAETLQEKLNLAGVYNAAGQHDQSLRLNEEVLETAHDQDLPLYESVAFNNLGQLAVVRGDLDAAASYLDRAATIQRERLDLDPARFEVTLSNSGMINAKRGDYATASARLREALELASQSTGPNGAPAATLKVLLGQIEYRAKNFAASRQDLMSAIAAYDTGITPMNPAVSPLRAVRLLALIDHAEGDLPAATRRLSQAFRSSSTSQRAFDPEGTCMLRFELARLSPAGSATQAMEAMEASEQLCAEDGTLQNPLVLYVRATAHAAHGQLDAAIQVFGQFAQASRTDAWPSLDPALAPLRNHPDFEGLLAQIVP